MQIFENKYVCITKLQFRYRIRNLVMLVLAMLKLHITCVYFKDRCRRICKYISFACNTHFIFLFWTDAMILLSSLKLFFWIFHHKKMVYMSLNSSVIWLNKKKKLWLDFSKNKVSLKQIEFVIIINITLQCFK